MPDAGDAGPKEIRARIDPGSPAGASFAIFGRNRPRRQDEAGLQCRASSLISVKHPAAEGDYDRSIFRAAWDIEVSERGNRDSTAPMRQRTGLDPISAVKMPERLTMAVDAWAEARHITRSDAICRLVELGLNVAPPALTQSHSVASDAALIEEIAVHEIEGLLDPAIPEDERERRVRRLTEGPPEFSHERIDLPKRR